MVPSSTIEAWVGLEGARRTLEMGRMTKGKGCSIFRQ